MNWLAHVVLSEPSPTFRIGNLLPDLMTGAELSQMPEVFQAGIACHRRIDAFTDGHPHVRRSVQRIAQSYRRFAPILVDVFYDHFLSVHWLRYCPQPLDEFVREIYDSFDGQRLLLPEALVGHLQRMRAENWLGAYGDISGVQLTLTRIERRFRRRVELGNAVAELVRHYDALEDDFSGFFPKVREHAEACFSKPDNPSSNRACH